MSTPEFPTAQPIRLFVTDLDDTLNPPEDEPLDLALLARVRERNDASALDETIPPLTLLTGRPQPYLYAMLQAVGGRMPAVFEHGFGLYSLTADRVDTHPAWTAERAADRARLLDACGATFIEPGLATLQIGKLAAVTLVPTLPETSRTLNDRAHALLREVGVEFVLHLGPKVVDYVPTGFDKGAGVRWLADAVGIPAAQMAAMGDSTTDAGMFPNVGLSIAPANAPAAVQAQATYVTKNATTAGVLEAYDAIIAHNRRL